MNRFKEDERGQFVASFFSTAAKLLVDEIDKRHRCTPEDFYVMLVSHTRPFFQHMCFRYRNQIISVLLEPVDTANNKSFLSKDDIRNQISEAEKSNLIPTLFPFDIKSRRPIYNGWHLVDSRTRESIELDDIASDEKVKMSDWERENIAIELVLKKLKEIGMTILSFCDIPGIYPQIWFKEKDSRPMSMTVRSAMLCDKTKVEIPLPLFQGKGAQFPHYFVNVEFNDLDDPQRPYLHRGVPFRINMSDLITLHKAVNERVYATISVEDAFVIRDDTDKKLD